MPLSMQPREVSRATAGHPCLLNQLQISGWTLIALLLMVLAHPACKSKESRSSSTPLRAACSLLGTCFARAGSRSQTQDHTYTCPQEDVTLSYRLAGSKKPRTRTKGTSTFYLPSCTLCLATKGFTIHTEECLGASGHAAPPVHQHIPLSQAVPFPCTAAVSSDLQFVELAHAERLVLPILQVTLPAGSRVSPAPPVGRGACLRWDCSPAHDAGLCNGVGGAAWRRRAARALCPRQGPRCPTPGPRL